MKLANRVVLVTGPARNIGREIARAAHAEGAHLVLAGLEPERIERLRDELGGRTLALDLDVTSDESVHAAFDAAVKAFGRIDIVVSNAGIMGSGAVEADETAFMERMLAVNLAGTYRVAHHAIPYLAMSRGYLLSVCSTAAVGHSPLQGAYCASKAGVYALMDCLRQEVAHQGVDVGVLYPNFVVPQADEEAGTDVLMQRLWGNVNASDDAGGTGAGTPVADVAKVAVDMLRRREREAVAPRSMGFILRFPRVVQRLFERRFKPRDIEAAVEASRNLAARGQAVTTAGRAGKV